MSDFGIGDEVRFVANEDKTHRYFWGEPATVVDLYSQTRDMKVKVDGYAHWLNVGEWEVEKAS